MNTLKKRDAYRFMVENYGPWKTWGRFQHLAYGLMRGVAYERMERYANDNPLSDCELWYALWKAGCFEEFPYVAGTRSWNTPHETYMYVRSIVTWVKKPVRARVEPSSNAEAAQ